MVQYYLVIVLTTASTFQSHTTSPSKKKTKHPETRENAGEQVVIDFSFESDWLKSGAIFLDQSKSEVKHKQSDNGYFRHLQDKCFYGTIFRR